MGLETLKSSTESVSKEKVISEINSSDIGVTLLVGEDEHRNMVDVLSQLAGKLDNGSVTIMNGIGHGLSEPGHMDYIVNTIRRLAPNNYN